MSQTATAPSVTSKLHTIANCVPSLVAADAKVQVALHLAGVDTFDAICAEHDDPAVTNGGGTESCPHEYRSACIDINGQPVMVYQSDVYARDTVDVQVIS